MPELPEVETVVRGLTPQLIGKKVSTVHVRQPKLRWPIEKDLPQKICKQTILSMSRRAKYLLIEFKTGTLLIHLGMSGRLYLVDYTKSPEKHDHVDVVLNDKRILRFTDPRRFGCMLWLAGEINEHFLLKNLGPEPLSKEFTGDYLFGISRKRQVVIKTFLMNQQIVVGVGNIYANEALFFAKIHPLRLADSLTKQESQLLVQSIKSVLKAAIKAGGTTLRDFVNGDAKPGYCKQSLKVYGRENLACVCCKNSIQFERIHQRSTFFCSQCQQ